MLLLHSNLWQQQWISFSCELKVGISLLAIMMGQRQKIEDYTMKKKKRKENQSAENGWFRVSVSVYKMWKDAFEKCPPPLPLQSPAPLPKNKQNKKNEATNCLVPQCDCSFVTSLQFGREKMEERMKEGKRPNKKPTAKVCVFFPGAALL